MRSADTCPRRSPPATGSAASGDRTTPGRCEPDSTVSGPLPSCTSSRLIATLTASRAGMPSSTDQNA
nr:hypothetical protein [Saccharothrix sp.]